MLYVGRLLTVDTRLALYIPAYGPHLYRYKVLRNLLRFKRSKMVGSATRSAQQPASAEAAPSEPDSILEMLQANKRATCLSPLPLLHWLYVTYVVDEKYEPHYPQTTMGSRQPGSIAQHNA